ncbi:MAG: hypothetical protein AAGD06_23685 [Acidobacteriota bacterium]
MLSTKITVPMQTLSGDEVVACRGRRPRWPPMPGISHLGSTLLGSTLLGLTLGAGAHAQAPVGGDVWVNSHRPGNQVHADVAVRAAGDFLVVWQSRDQDGDCDGIFGRRVDARGLPIGGEVQLNVYTTSCQTWPSAETLADGRFAVAWQSHGQDGDGDGIFGGVFDHDLSPLSGEVQVNTHTTGAQQLPSVAALADGGFVVSWQSEGQDGDSKGIFGRRFDHQGIPLASEFRANDVSAGTQQDPSVAARPGGGFAIVWSSGPDPWNTNSIEGALFGATGSVARRFATGFINYDGEPQELPDVAVAQDGTFEVVWRDQWYLAGPGSSAGQRFDADGQPLTDALRTIPYFAYTSPPKASHGEAGEFVVVWANEGRYGADGRVFDGDLQGQSFFDISPYWVSTYTQGPEVAHRPGTGDFVVAWARTSPGDVDGYDVYAKIFGGTIFRDGFESGNLGAWSLARGGDGP